MLKRIDDKSFFSTDAELKAARAVVRLIFESFRYRPAEKFGKHILPAYGLLLTDVNAKQSAKLSGGKFDNEKHCDALYDFFVRMSDVEFDNYLLDGAGLPVLWADKDDKGNIKRYYRPTREQLKHK